MVISQSHVNKVMRKMSCIIVSLQLKLDIFMNRQLANGTVGVLCNIKEKMVVFMKMHLEVKGQIFLLNCTYLSI